MFGFSVNSIELAVNAVRGNGGAIISAPASSERGLLTVVSDPDGHRLELLEPDKALTALILTQIHDSIHI